MQQSLLHSEYTADFHRNLCNGICGSFEIWLFRKKQQKKKNTLCHLHRNKWEDSLSASKQSGVTSQYIPPPHPTVFVTQ